MKVGIPVGGFHQGNTAEYVLRAFQKLGHSAQILNQLEFQRSAENNECDFYFCVDSGETLDLTKLPDSQRLFPKLAFWFIDYRHNKHRATRTPTDFENARLINQHGGWIFQAQHEDVLDCQAAGLTRVSWLPLAADPEIWSDVPVPKDKLFDLCFVGNIHDQGRLEAIVLVKENFPKFGFFGNGALWKEKAAAALRASRLGFNIASWYGTPAAFDVNMRFFETLSAGIPLVTDWVESLRLFFPKLPSFIRVFRNKEEIVPVLREALQDEAFLATGALGRQWILEHATYEKRLRDALSVFQRV